MTASYTEATLIVSSETDRIALKRSLKIFEERHSSVYLSLIWIRNRICKHTRATQYTVRTRRTLLSSVFVHQAWWSRCTVWWSTQTWALAETARATATATLSLYWFARMSSSHSWWRRHWWPWDTHTAQLYRQVVSSVWLQIIFTSFWSTFDNLMSCSAARWKVSRGTGNDTVHYL